NHSCCETMRRRSGGTARAPRGVAGRDASRSASLRTRSNLQVDLGGWSSTAPMAVAVVILRDRDLTETVSPRAGPDYADIWNADTAPTSRNRSGVGIIRISA